MPSNIPPVVLSVIMVSPSSLNMSSTPLLGAAGTPAGTAPLPAQQTQCSTQQVRCEQGTLVTKHKKGSSCVQHTCRSCALSPQYCIINLRMW